MERKKNEKRKNEKMKRYMRWINIPRIRPHDFQRSIHYSYFNVNCLLWIFRANKLQDKRSRREGGREAGIVVARKGSRTNETIINSTLSLSLSLFSFPSYLFISIGFNQFKIRSLSFEKNQTENDNIYIYIYTGVYKKWKMRS